MKKSKVIILPVLLFLTGLLHNIQSVTIQGSNKSRSKTRQDAEAPTSLDPVVQNCLNEMSEIFNQDSLEDDPANAFNNYIDDFCMKEMLDVPNGVVPSTCFYSGYFLLVYLTQNKQNQTRLDAYVNDYCNNYQKALPMRTQFVKELKKLKGQQYDDQCMNLLQQMQGLNVWFDPIDPLTSISSQEICDLHKKLFDSLAQKGVHSLAEYVSFSYLITLDLYLNAYEQEDYESCVNSQVLNSPKSYCEDFIEESVNFELWNMTAQETQCIKAGQVVTSSCDGLTYCDACAVLMAQLYQTFEDDINTMYSVVFQRYENKMFATLDAENKKVQTQIDNMNSDNSQSEATVNSQSQSQQTPSQSQQSSQQQQQQQQLEQSEQTTSSPSQTKSKSKSKKKD